jgi:transcriptional regulator with XRE-family HTH domain
MNTGMVIGLLSGLIGALLAGLLTDLAIKETEGWLFRVPSWLLRMAVLRVPVAVRDGLSEEWTAELQIALRDMSDRPVTRLIRGTLFAFGLLLTSRQIARALGSARSEGPVDNVATAVSDDNISAPLIALPPLITRTKTSPSVRRRRLGSELRRLREAHFYDLEEVAERLGLAPSPLSRIEMSIAPLRTTYLAAMFEMYGILDPEQRQVMSDMARNGHRKGWWGTYDDVLPTGMDIYAGLEAEATALQVFENRVIHGLLQTEHYARTVLATMHMKHNYQQIERAVELRIQRQRALTQVDPLRLWLILDETAIGHMVGSPEIMHGQLTHLLEANSWPNVTLQVLPLSSGVHPGLSGSFTILEFSERTDSDVVYTEGVAGQAYLERKSEVQACQENFEELRAAALSPSDSARLIGRMAKIIID